MEKFFSALVKWIGDHLSPIYLFPLAAISGFLVFAPINWLAYFGLEQLARSYRGIFSIAFFAATILLMGHAASAAGQKLKKVLSVRKLRRFVRTNLENLGVDEVSVLQQYAESQKASIHFSPANGAVQGLIDKAILYRPSQQMRPDGYVAHNLTSEARKYMRHDRFQEILDINSKNMGFTPSKPKK
jgi:hypothetical protein